MRLFRSFCCVLAFGGAGLMVLANGKFNDNTGHREFFFDWVDSLIDAFGVTVVGYGLILFGLAFGAFWMHFGHDR